MIVLDTNVLSALMRPENNAAAVDWINRQPASVLWTTAISVMEVRTGLHLLPEGRRRSGLTAGFDMMLAGPMHGRLLPFDTEAAECASDIAAMRRQEGLNIDIGDHQIAGIVRARRATLATRNVKDFDGLYIPLVNPWTD